MKKKTNKHYFLKWLQREGKIHHKRYNERRIKKFILKYRKTGDPEYKRAIITECYPIIFTILKRFGSKFNTTKKLFDNQDLFDESVIAISLCIDSYSFKKKTGFVTFAWPAISRRIVRFVTRNIVNPEKFFMSYDDDENEDYSDESSVNRKKLLNNNVSEEKTVMTSLLSSLDKPERKIVLYKRNGYSVKQICRLLHINQSSYYRILKNIKNKIRKEI